MPLDTNQGARQSECEHNIYVLSSCAYRSSVSLPLINKQHTEEIVLSIPSRSRTWDFFSPLFTNVASKCIPAIEMALVFAIMLAGISTQTTIRRLGRKV